MHLPWFDTPKRGNFKSPGRWEHHVKKCWLLWYSHHGFHYPYHWWIKTMRLAAGIKYSALALPLVQDHIHQRLSCGNVFFKIDILHEIIGATSVNVRECPDPQLLGLVVGTESNMRNRHQQFLYLSSCNHGSGKWIHPISISFHNLGWFSTLHGTLPSSRYTSSSFSFSTSEDFVVRFSWRSSLEVVPPLRGIHQTRNQNSETESFQGVTWNTKSCCGTLIYPILFLYIYIHIYVCTYICILLDELGIRISCVYIISIYIYTVYTHTVHIHYCSLFIHKKHIELKRNSLPQSGFFRQVWKDF